MSFVKFLYTRINWVNKSDSPTSPVGKTNLNHMDSAIYNIAENLNIAYDELNAGKFEEADAGKVIVGMPTWDSETGILTFQFYDGTQFSVDFNIEKIPVSFSMDSAGVITMTTSDGTEWTADIGDVVPDYSFEDSDRIAFTKTKNADGSYSISADIRKNSITDEHLQPNYLADITAQASNAAASAGQASEFADNAAFDAKLAQSYSVGGSGIREGEGTDNSKYYKEECQKIFNDFQQAGTVAGVKGGKESEYRKGLVNLTPENIGAIPESVKLWDEDLNNIKTAGFYHSGGGNTVIHKPSGVDYFGLEVVQCALSSWKQILHDIKNGKIYRRHFIDGSWTAWVEEINDIGALPKDGTAVNADMVDSFHASSFLGNGTGYVHPGVNGGDANDYKTEFHGFVFNMSNTPSVNGSNYGFLDVCCFDGSGFTPSKDGVVLQKFTHYSTGYVFIRTYVSGSWTAWKQLSTSDHSHSYNDLSNRWILRSISITISASTAISNGFYGGGGSATVGSYGELVFLSISGSMMIFPYNWSYSGTTLSISGARLGSGSGTVTAYYLTRS